jgi:hypothetical protein
MAWRSELQAANFSLFLSPDLYLFDLDLSNGTASLVQMDRQSYQKSAFLDDRIVSSSSMRYHVDIRDALLFLEKYFSTRKRMNYIFHTAFCCSTLLSKALDVQGKTIVYREPVSLHQLATLKRWRHEYPDYDEAGWVRLLRLVAAFLSRSTTETEIPVIKPTDSCNNIVTDLLTLDAGTAGLLIYSDLESFLVSSLKTGDRRSFTHKLLKRATVDAGDTVLGEINTGGLSDARAAAFVWAVQMDMCKKALLRHATQLRSLDAATFLDDPRHTLAAITRHLGIDFTDSDIGNIVDGDTMIFHSKTTGGSPYNAATRARENKASADLHRNEINDGLHWADSVLKLEADIELPHAL